MTTTKRKVEIKEFAERVERMCDFLIGKVIEENGRDESNDLKIIEDLKEDAADIQFDRVHAGTKAIEGLSDYMHGVIPKES